MNPPPGRAFPFIYGSRDENVFDKRVKAGSVLWVISASPDDRPPSLIAKLNVIGRLDQSGKKTFGVPEAVARTFRKLYDYIAVGDPTESRFYGYNNASRALLSVKVKWVNEERTLSGENPCPEGTCGWKPSYAVPLNRPAEIVSDPKPFLDLHKDAERSVFISWKRSDNWARRSSIRKLAYTLADEGISVWLDVLAFPPSIALRTKVDPCPDLVKRLLHYGYKHCKGLLAIETIGYGTKGISENWTEMEWTGSLDPDSPPCPPPFRWVYRFDQSEYLSKFEQTHNNLISGVDWHELALKLRREMKSRR